MSQCDIEDATTLFYLLVEPWTPPSVALLLEASLASHLDSPFSTLMICFRLLHDKFTQEQSGPIALVLLSRECAVDPHSLSVPPFHTPQIYSRVRTGRGNA